MTAAFGGAATMATTLATDFIANGGTRSPLYATDHVIAIAAVLCIAVLFVAYVLFVLVVLMATRKDDSDAGDGKQAKT